MTEQHPIIPPLELIQQWVDEYIKDKPVCVAPEFIAIRAAQYGAKQELKSCWEWLNARIGGIYPDELLSARRPKPPSLKEQAKHALETLNQTWTTPKELDAVITIRRALEQLND